MVDENMCSRFNMICYAMCNILEPKYIAYIFSIIGFQINIDYKHFTLGLRF